jgi:hypothetical protein
MVCCYFFVKNYLFGYVLEIEYSNISTKYNFQTYLSTIFRFFFVKNGKIIVFRISIKNNTGASEKKTLKI